MGYAQQDAGGSHRPDLSNWYTIERIAGITGDSVRTLRRKFEALTESVVRPEQVGRGRPRILYHYTVDPRLAAAHVMGRSPEADPAASHPTSPTSLVVAPDDMAIAKLRLMAIHEYRARQKTMSHQEAASATCRDWQQRPREEAVARIERLAGGNLRKHVQVVSISPFKAGSLRIWDSLYKESIPDGHQAALLALVPKRKGNVGRKGIEIPEDILLFVAALSTSTARADVAKAVAQAEADYKAGGFPQASLSTWRRKLRALDPQRIGNSLSHSISRFRQQCSPDIEINWNELAYNARWEIDDVQKDWYAFASDGALIRPYAYAIIRASTRQWIALVTSEAPITQAQIRTLVGTAMAAPQGGIPGEIKFERGATASDPHLEHVLNLLGVKVGHTSMDEGQIHPAAFEDRAKGHFQGKPLVESGFRGLHELEWNMPGQVGPEERHTAPARLATMQAEAKRRKEKGEFFLFPRPEQWHALCRQTCEKANTTPNSGLLMIVDPETGKPRHMTPNEAAQHKQADAVTIMPPQYLPLFSVKGVRVKVTKNGFRLNNHSFGRFDDELKTHEQVTAYVDELFPEFAYVVELGRCVERYELEEYGQHEQFARKRSQEKTFRNQYESAMDRAIAALEGDGMLMVDRVQLTEDPTPARERKVIEVGELDCLVGRMNEGIARFRADREAFSRRFVFHGPADEAEGELVPAGAATAPEARSRRGSLMATSDKFASAVSIPSVQPNNGGEE